MVTCPVDCTEVMTDEEEQAHFDELFEDIFIELEDKVQNVHACMYTVYVHHGTCACFSDMYVRM